MAWCYDAIASGYSRGAIARSRETLARALVPGSRVLYAGVGTGADALLAARRGVEITCIDQSAAMLERLRARLAHECLTARLVHADVLEHDPCAPFDGVVASYFLNLYAGAELLEVMRRLVTWIRPGGHLMIADFAPPPRSARGRVTYAAHYRPINVAARLLGLCALHPIHDYAQHFEELGLEVVTRTPERPFRWAPAFYEALISRAR